MEHSKRFVNIGFNNTVNIDKIVSVMTVDSAPNRRLVQQRKDECLILDCTCGRKTKSMIVTTDKFVVLSALNPTTINMRVNASINGVDEITREEGEDFISDEEEF